LPFVGEVALHERFDLNPFEVEVRWRYLRGRNYHNTINLINNRIASQNIFDFCLYKLTNQVVVYGNFVTILEQIHQALTPFYRYLGLT
jgi:hypothetical protein